MSASCSSSSTAFPGPIDESISQAIEKNFPNSLPMPSFHRMSPSVIDSAKGGVLTMRISLSAEID